MHKALHYCLLWLLAAYHLLAGLQRAVRACGRRGGHRRQGAAPAPDRLTLSKGAAADAGSATDTASSAYIHVLARSFMVNLIERCRPAQRGAGLPEADYL